MSTSFQGELESILLLRSRREAAAQRCAARDVHRYGFVAPHPNPSPDGRGAKARSPSGRRHSSEGWNPFAVSVSVSVSVSVAVAVAVVSNSLTSR
jgi:hypothetical protein